MYEGKNHFFDEVVLQIQGWKKFALLYTRHNHGMGDFGEPCYQSREAGGLVIIHAGPLFHSSKLTAAAFLPLETKASSLVMKRIFAL